MRSLPHPLESIVEKQKFTVIGSLFHEWSFPPSIMNYHLGQRTSGLWSGFAWTINSVRLFQERLETFHVCIRDAHNSRWNRLNSELILSFDFDNELSASLFKSKSELDWDQLAAIVLADEKLNDGWPNGITSGSGQTWSRVANNGPHRNGRRSRIAKRMIFRLVSNATMSTIERSFKIVIRRHEMSACKQNRNKLSAM